MIAREETDFNRGFHRRLTQLRSEVNAVSAEHRPALREMANQIEQQHCQIQKDCAVARELAGDLSLGIASTMFNIWACQREAGQVCDRLTEK
jgi:hypothetical protein